jgi:hypothetical protein
MSILRWYLRLIDPVLAYTQERALRYLAGPTS